MLIASFPCPQDRVFRVIREDVSPGAFLFVMSIHLARTFAKINRALEDKNAEIEQELPDVAQMQTSLLPKSSPEPAISKST